MLNIVLHITTKMVVDNFVTGFLYTECGSKLWRFKKWCGYVLNK